MSYSIYVIHEKKKVGLAKNLDDRLAQQGYTTDDKTVDVYMKDIADLSVARMVEKEVQKAFGYTAHESGPDLVDIALEKRKIKKMGNSYKTYEGNTIGFPIDSESVLDLIGQGVTLETNKGVYKASADDVAALYAAGHFRPSKFGGKLKTYIYTKIVDNYFKDKKDESKLSGGKSSGLDELIANIHDWADNRGILAGRIETQTLKLGEEFGELQKAVLKNKPLEIKDAIGDIIVVLVSIAHFNGHSVSDAVQMAYDTISKRTGYTNEKGDFIKTHYNGEEIKSTL